MLETTSLISEVVVDNVLTASITASVDVFTPSTEVLTPSTEVLIPSTDVSTPSTEVLTPSTDSLIESTDEPTPSTETFRESNALVWFERCAIDVSSLVDTFSSVSLDVETLAAIPSMPSPIFSRSAFEAEKEQKHSR